MALAPNVWTQMNYVPPRGQCNFKASLMSPKCPCLRFMLHPLKSTSSYECDGCSHHASFHSLENKAEDEIRKRWEAEDKEKEAEEERALAHPRKRLRGLEDGNDTKSRQSRGGRLMLENGANSIPGSLRDEFSDAESSITIVAGSSRTRTKATRGGKAKQSAARRAPAWGKNKVTEIVEDDDILELD